MLLYQVRYLQLLVTTITMFNESKFQVAIHEFRRMIFVIQMQIDLS